MFDALIDRFAKLRRRLAGFGKLTDTEIREALREVRTTLLEADVNYKVVGGFVRTVEAELKKTEIAASLRPEDVITSLLHRTMTEMLGTHAVSLDLSQSPCIISLIGLQGTGKTTLAGKLGNVLRKRRPMLVACDPKRPAASEQLQSVARRAGCDFFPCGSAVVDTAVSAINHARSKGNGLVILDTAGRLHVDEELMSELQALEKSVKPHVTLLVLDGTVGQDAINQATEFSARLTITGCCFTKLDADARGGAVLSVRNATGLPVIYLGTGERLEDLEQFHPDRIASRILGLGDVRGLAERIQATTDRETSQALAEKLLKGKFDFDDFLQQLKALRKMGSLSGLLSLLPGASAAKVNVDDADLVRIEAMIRSMTPAERRNPDIIDGSRRRRIASGSGTKVADVNRLLREFQEARELARRLTKAGPGFRLRGGRH